MASRNLSQASLDSAIRDFHDKIQRISNSRDSALISYAAAKLNDVLIECQANGVPVEEDDCGDGGYEDDVRTLAADWDTCIEGRSYLEGDRPGRYVPDPGPKPSQRELFLNGVPLCDF